MNDYFKSLDTILAEEQEQADFGVRYERDEVLRHQEVAALCAVVHVRHYLPGEENA